MSLRETIKTPGDSVRVWGHLQRGLGGAFEEVQAGRAQGYGSAQGRWLGCESGWQTEGKRGGALQTAGQWEGTGPLRWPAHGLPLSHPDDVGGPSPGCPTWLSGPVPVLPLPQSLRRSFTLGEAPLACCPLCARTHPASPPMALMCHRLRCPPTDGYRWRISVSLALHQVPDVSLTLTRNA